MTRWTEEQLTSVLARQNGKARVSVQPVKANKYSNIKVEIDGHRFDSKREGRRYEQLKLLETARRIRSLTVHPSFDLAVNGEHICKYTADFAYEDMRGNFIVEDVKSKFTKTEAYGLRKRLIRVIHRIDVVEV
jgi:hypothetical protein